MNSPKKNIGGFFELELELLEPNVSNYHFGLALSSGRACLSFICQQLQISKVYVPFYTCNALLEPFLQNKIAVQFYAITNDLEIADDIQPGKNEYLVYINYFGLKKNYCQKLWEQFGNRLILDNTQAYFERGNDQYWSFNSARKFFGVPDGGYLYGPDLHSDNISVNTFHKCNHLLERRFGNQQLAYRLFTEYEKTFNTGIRKMSNISEWMLNHLNYPEIIKRRTRNFHHYHNALQAENALELDFTLQGTPFCYPLLLDRNYEKKIFHLSNIFIPTLWNDVLERKNSAYIFERYLSDNLLILPVDHRYTEEDCDQVIAFIKNLVRR